LPQCRFGGRVNIVEANEENFRSRRSKNASKASWLSTKKKKEIDNRKKSGISIKTVL